VDAEMMGTLRFAHPTYLASALGCGIHLALVPYSQKPVIKNKKFRQNDRVDALPLIHPTSSAFNLGLWESFRVG